MSIRPYNNCIVFDLSNVQQPYVNSTTEIGYFSGTNLGIIQNGLWRSLPAVLNTKNGIATADASGGIILNAGIYKINLSLFPTSTQDGSSNISFNFGTQYLYDFSSSQVVNAFGGVCPTGMFTYDPSNNPYIPGIISWIANGYSSGNNTVSNFLVNTSSYELGYNYNNVGYPDKALYSGNCTTKMTFILDSSATIFFNVSTNSSTGVTMGNCSFTLELVSTYSVPVPTGTLTWSRTSAVSNNWQSIASSSNGQYLAAVTSPTIGITNSGGIWTSSNYGDTWIQRISNSALAWLTIASSSSGQYLAAAPSGGVILTSSNSGLTWDASNNSGNRTWRSIASSSTGQYLAAVVRNGSIYISSNFGGTWTARGSANGLPNSTQWQSIASSGDGQYLAAAIDGGPTSDPSGGIYTSSNYGLNWRRTNAIRSSWTSITSSIDGKYLAAVIFNAAIYTSSNYGATWILRDNGVPTSGRRWKSITSSSNGQYLAATITNSSSTTPNGAIYTSVNYGVNWSLVPTSTDIPSTGVWNSIASSSDGTKLAVVNAITIPPTTNPPTPPIPGSICTGVYS